jgi:BTB/POZ domain
METENVKHLFSKHKFSFEINHVRGYEKDQEFVSAKLKLPEVDGFWQVQVLPKTTNPSNTRNEHMKFNFAVTDLPKKMWKSKPPLQFHVDILSEGSRWMDSGFLNVTSEKWIQESYALRDTVLQKATPNGSLKFNIVLEIKLPAQLFGAYNDVATYHARMLENELFCDFKFIVKGKEFKVHRAILASASPVFAKMFTTEMKEGNEKLCNVEDFEPEIFGHLLRFIYGGELPDDIWEVAMKLYDISHYYDIEKLKEICLRELPTALEEKNALEMFNWACKYELEELKVLAWTIVKR